MLTAVLYRENIQVQSLCAVDEGVGGVSDGGGGHAGNGR